VPCTSVTNLSAFCSLHDMQQHHYQGCRHSRGYGDSHRDSHGYGYGMGMETAMNPHGPVGILWGFLNGREVKRKRVTLYMR